MNKEQLQSKTATVKEKPKDGRFNIILRQGEIETSCANYTEHGRDNGYPVTDRVKMD